MGNGFVFICICATAAFLRFWLSISNLSNFVRSRVEISTPVNSWLRVKEGIYFIENGVNPYSGDQYHQHPAILWLFRFLDINCSELTPYFFIIIDILTAYILQRATRLYLLLKTVCEKHKNTDESAKILLVANTNVERIAAFVGYSYLFNPFAIVSCAAQTTTVLENFLLALCLYFSFSGYKFCSILTLAFISVCSFYPTVLVVFLAVHFGKLCSKSCDSIFWKEVLSTILLFVCVGALFVYLSVFLFWGPSYLQNTYGFILSVTDLTPNVGIFWYFLTEMFEHFRAFFVWVFQLNILVYIIPLAISLQNDSWLLFLQYTMIISIFKSYPSVGDVAFYMALLPSISHLYPLMRNSFVVGCALVCTAVIGPVMWSLWINAGSANANFYFAVTLGFSCAQIFLLADILCAYLKRNLHLEFGMKPAINGKPAKLLIQ